MRASGEAGIDLSINMGWVLHQDSDPGSARSSFEAALRMSRRNGDRSGIALAGLGLACLAADAGDWHRAAHAPRRCAGLPRPVRATVGGA
jgi:hypothetical protein